MEPWYKRAGDYMLDAFTDIDTSFKGARADVREWASPVTDWMRDADSELMDGIRHYLGPHAGPPVQAALKYGPEMFGPGADVRDMTEGSSQLAQALMNRDYSGALEGGALMAGGTLMAALPGPSVSSMKRGVDEVVDALPMDEASRMGIRAYHGSPHDFDKFDMNKIGTGEGAQAYGHGLYFAENERVARDYRNKLARDRATIGDLSVDTTRRPQEAVDAWRAASSSLPDDVRRSVSEKIQNRLGANEILDDIDIDFYGEHTDAVADILKSVPGRMYEVNINANPDDFLDWDKPLSEQPERVRTALGVDPQVDEDAFLEKALAELQEDMLSGGRTEMNAADRVKYKAIEDALERSIWRKQKAANYIDRTPEMTARLKEQGIPGIKYLDQGSRAAGEGSRNYVVFDDKIIDILKKYGLQLPLAAGSALALALQGYRNEQGDDGTPIYRREL